MSKCNRYVPVKIKKCPPSNGNGPSPGPQFTIQRTFTVGGINSFPVQITYTIANDGTKTVHIDNIVFPVIGLPLSTGDMICTTVPLPQEVRPQMNTTQTIYGNFTGGQVAMPILFDTNGKITITSPVSETLENGISAGTFTYH